MTINRAYRQDGPSANSHEPPVAERPASRATTDHDGSTLARLDAIEVSLDEMLIQLDQIRENLVPLLTEFAPAQSEEQDRSMPG